MSQGKTGHGSQAPPNFPGRDKNLSRNPDRRNVSDQLCDLSKRLICGGAGFVNFFIRVSQGQESGLKL